jgi:hypothetical protein
VIKLFADVRRLRTAVEAQKALEEHRAFVSGGAKT